MLFYYYFYFVRKKVRILMSSLNHCSVISVNGGGEGYNYLGYTGLYCCKRILQLRNHAACHGTICFISLKIGMGNHWNHAVVILRITEHAFLFKTIYQCHIIGARALAVSLAMVSALVLGYCPCRHGSMGPSLE